MAHKINISGVIGWEVTAKDVKDEFKKIGPTDEVDIELNSPGGSVFEGIEISNAIKTHKGKTNLIITSFAASMGSHIAMSADHVSAFEDSTFMIHNVSTFEWGDHRALRKTANVIESLTNVLSKAYVAQTGKEKSEILALMDDETWFFGDEILNAGFVDEIIKAEEPEEKEDAVAFQRLVFMDSIEQMKGSEKSKTDLDKLAAYFSENKPASTQNNGGPLAASAETSKDLPATPPAKTADTQPKNEEKMTLAEFLAANPEAKVEHNNLIATAKTEGRTELKTELKALSEEVKPIMSSDVYKQRIKTAGFEVMTGERTKQSFMDMVAVVDENNEADKSDEVKKNQPAATKGEESQTEEQQAKAQTAANAKTVSDDINNKQQVT